MMRFAMLVSSQLRFLVVALLSLWSCGLAAADASLLIDEARQALPLDEAAEQSGASVSEARKKMLEEKFQVEIQQRLAETKALMQDPQLHKELKQALEQTQAQHQQVTSNTVPQFDNLDATLDMPALIEKYKEFMQGKLAAAYNIYVFISASMPASSLERLILQAAQLEDATVVMHGFIDNDFGKTVDAMSPYLDKDPKKEAGFIVDPRIFREYSINKVPAFTVTEPYQACQLIGACPETPTPNHQTVYGDVSLDYALEKLIEFAPEFETYLQPKLHYLRGEI